MWTDIHILIRSFRWIAPNTDARGVRRDAGTSEGLAMNVVSKLWDRV